MTYRPFLTLAVLGVIVVLGALGLRAFGVGDRDGMTRAAVPPMGAEGATVPTGRTVRLSHAMPQPRRGDLLGAKLVRGAMPARWTSAVVLSDTQCDADAHGISRCLDRLRLADGRVITVRHVHDMRVVRCLTPGERVRVVPAKTTPA